MQKWYSKYKRGDVWFLHMPTETGDGTGVSVQKKSRPYVIVSCEENNNCAPTLNVVPITTRDSDHLPPHVYFRYEDGTAAARNQLVLCEQITTVGVDVFNDPRSFYMYSFNLDFMNKIDEALAAQLGLRPRVADMSVIENLINKIAAQKEQDIQKLRSGALEARVEDIAAILSKKFDVPLRPEDSLTGAIYNNADLEYAPKAVVEEINKVAESRTNISLPETKISTATLSSVKSVETAAARSSSKPSKHNTWTTEKMSEFLEDCNKLSFTEISEKWNIKKSSIPQTRYQLTKRLKTANPA